MLSDEGVRDAFKKSVVQLAPSKSMDLSIKKAFVKEKKIMAPITRFVASQAKKEVSEVARQLVTLASPSPPPSPEDSSSSEDEWKPLLAKKSSRHRKKRKKVCRLSPVIGIHGRGDDPSKVTTECRAQTARSG